MRILFLLIVLLLNRPATGQELSLYKDSVYHIQIGVPTSWLYGKPKNYPELIFMGIRNRIDSAEFVENFNINSFKMENSNLDKAFEQMVYYSRENKDFQMIKQGSIELNNQPFKWIISTETNNYVNSTMSRYVLLTYEDKKVYILTFTSTPKNFNRYFPVFERIAQTFKIK